MLRSVLLGLLRWSLLLTICFLTWRGGWFRLGTAEEVTYRIQAPFWTTLLHRVTGSFLFAAPALIPLTVLALAQKPAGKRL